MRSIPYALILTLLFSVIAFADIARPNANRAASVKKPAAIDTHLSIQLDREAKEARLIIPRTQLKQLRAELESLDDGSDDTAAVNSADRLSRLQTIVSGLFLSLAFVFAGVWFMRSEKLSTKGGKVAAGALLVFAGGAFATIVYGNAGPPPEARSITGKMFAQGMHYYKFGGGKIKLEISDDETNPKLIVPDPATTPTPEE